MKGVGYVKVISLVVKIPQGNGCLLGSKIVPGGCKDCILKWRRVGRALHVICKFGGANLITIKVYKLFYL